MQKARFNGQKFPVHDPEIDVAESNDSLDRRIQALKNDPRKSKSQLARIFSMRKHVNPRTPKRVMHRVLPGYSLRMMKQAEYFAEKRHV